MTWRRHEDKVCYFIGCKPFWLTRGCSQALLSWEIWRMGSSLLSEWWSLLPPRIQYDNCSAFLGQRSSASHSPIIIGRARATTEYNARDTRQVERACTWCQAASRSPVLQCCARRDAMSQSQSQSQSALHRRVGWSHQTVYPTVYPTFCFKFHSVNSASTVARA